jgi:ABC-type cobalamin/Fe3+-siderophores transport system ATPase subunit
MDRKGKLLFLCGKMAAGKSTLLKALAERIRRGHGVFRAPGTRRTLQCRSSRTRVTAAYSRRWSTPVTESEHAVKAGLLSSRQAAAGTHDE